MGPAVGDPNRPTGLAGLIAVDKRGNQILLLDPQTYETTAALTGFQSRVHELAISPDHARAYAPIYGDGVHGANPNPGSSIVVVDLRARRHAGTIALGEFRAPHGMRWGPAGQLYCVCEDSGVVVEIDAGSGDIGHVIDVGSRNAHRIEVLPDGSKLYTENEEDASVTVVDLRARVRIRDVPTPNGLCGLGLSPDGRTAVLVDAARPEVLVLDTATDAIVRTIRLSGHAQAAQIARYSPDGRALVVTGNDEGIGTILSADFGTQRTMRLGAGPMDMAFHPDGATVVIGNQDDGTLSVVDLPTATVRRTVPAGVGVEALAFY